jgi:hypothetical protein
LESPILRKVALAVLVVVLEVRRATPAEQVAPEARLLRFRLALAEAKLSPLAGWQRLQAPGFRLQEKQRNASDQWSAKEGLTWSLGPGV